MTVALQVANANMTTSFFVFGNTLADSAMARPGDLPSAGFALEW
jgi:hypothetical protein